MNGALAKTTASIAVLLIGLILTVVAVGLLPSTEPTSSSGVIIDFGGYETQFVETGEGDVPLDSIRGYCDSNGMELVTDGTRVISIDGVTSGTDGHWSLYVVKKGDLEWTEVDWDITDPVSEFSAVCYGFCKEGDVPSPGVDRTGEPIHGYDVPERVISLAPSATETICFNDGLSLLVGTDQYSNHPDEVVEGHRDGSITIVGSFTSPSFEMVLKQDPDMVVCISTQNAHIQMASNLREAGVDVLVLDGGESIDAVLDNIHVTGVALGKQIESTQSIRDLQSDMDEVADTIDSFGQKWDKRVMVALSAVKAPWVSGGDTYVDDVMSLIHMDNIYSEESGWVQVNAETISKYDPEVIVVVSTDFQATQGDYDLMLDSMSKEWRGTEAFDTGEIYLFTGDAADCASRAGPRVAELTELLGRAIHGDAFDDGVDLPMFIGDDYTKYLTITRSDAA